MRPDVDCVVVGAGLVGAAQALALQRLGLTVLVIDTRKPLGGEPGGDVRGLALAPSSRNILRGLGIWPALAGHVIPIEEVRVSDQGHFGAALLQARDVGFEALGYVIPADRLMHAFEAALVAAVPVRWQTTIESIETADPTARVTVRTGDVAETLSTALVIGADGAGSRVRELLGIPTRTRDYRQHAIVVNMHVAGVEPRVAYERFTPHGPIALLPIGHERHVAVRCCAAADLDRLLALDDASYAAELLAGFGSRFRDFSALGKRSHHPLRLARAQRITAERAVLVGAAANCIHPNGAQGLNLGLRDVAALAAALRGEPQRDPGAPAHLAAYADSRAADHRNVLRFTDALAQVFASRLPFVPVLRDAAMVAFDMMPPVKRALIRRACGLFGETPLLAWSPDTMTRHTVDFAVAGAGVVGITAALLLARNGYEVALIDPAAPPGPLPRTNDYDIRTYALTRASMRVFSALGAASTLVHERLAAFTRMQVWDAGSDGMLRFDAARLGRESLGTMIEHANLHAALHALAAGTRSLTRIRAAVAATETGDERCSLQLDSGDHIDAALVLACDGANSPLRTQLGIAPNASAFRQHAIICNVETGQAHALIARQRFLDHGPLAFLPLPPAHACAVVWTTSPEAAAAAVAAPDAVFAAQLADAFDGELGAIRSTGPRRAVPLQRLHAQHYVAGRAVLLGDAAHVVHPLAGQGLNLGIMDAAALAEVFGQRDELELKFPRSALSRFERMRRGENLVMLQTTTALNRLFRDQRRIGKRARGLGMRAVDAMVPLKHWLMLRAMGDAGDVPAIAAFHPAQ